MFKYAPNMHYFSELMVTSFTENKSQVLTTRRQIQRVTNRLSSKKMEFESYARWLRNNFFTSE